MRHTAARSARTWHALSPQEKQERLAEVRRRQQAQIELEVRRLSRGR